jgi:hypothetical protein
METSRQQKVQVALDLALVSPRETPNVEAPSGSVEDKNEALIIIYLYNILKKHSL